VIFTGYLEGHLPSVQTYYYITISQYRLYGIREQQFNGRAFVANSPKRVWSVQAADTPFEAYDVLMRHILEARGDQDGARP
jgi:hypothetical protein